MKKEYITIFTASLARYLLKKGYEIIDIKAHRDLENASVFIFLNQGNLMKDVHEFKTINN